MLKILVCWIGRTDIKAALGEIKDLGPIAEAVKAKPFDAVQLLADVQSKGYNVKKNLIAYKNWLEGHDAPQSHIDFHKLKSPTDFEEIFSACRKTLRNLQEANPSGVELTFHLSPGTPHMASTWLILSETEFPASLIDSSIEQGVKDVRLPVSLTAEWLPAYIMNRDAKLEGSAPELPPPAAQFKNILHHSGVMKKVIYRANKVAPRSVPVLIEGESGTGKELFARAIHKASLRQDQAFIPVNCGALPKELIESTLFGHKKGAFTGADSDQTGKFVQADGGTLFLDELGEMSKEAQVRLLRVLEDKEVWPIGAKKSTKVDVRIIAATNRSLINEVSEGHFREDLFYRLAVAVLKLPPIRHRGQDIKLLIRHLLDQVNEESREEPSYKYKKLSPEGENIMLQHPWPGNVRELLNTLRRLSVWSDDVMISADDVREAILSGPADPRTSADVLGHELGQGFDLNGLIEYVERYYVEKAWLQSSKRKTEATNLLGMPNYQTLTKRLEKYGLV